MGSRQGMEKGNLQLHRDLNPRPSSPYQVAIQTTLSRPRIVVVVVVVVVVVTVVVVVLVVVVVTVVVVVVVVVTVEAP